MSLLPACICPAIFLPLWALLINNRLFVSGSTGSMFWAWLVVLSFSQALYNRKLSAAPRVALLLVTVVTMYVAFVVQNDWKSGWISLPLGWAWCWPCPPGGWRWHWRRPP